MIRATLILAGGLILAYAVGAWLGTGLDNEILAGVLGGVVAWAGLNLAGVLQG